jgi:quinol monooxygenase YgiN
MILIAGLKAKPGNEAEVENKLKEMVAKVSCEKGTLVYTLHRSQKDPARFMFYEKYTDKEANKYHANTSYFKALEIELKDLLDGEPQLEFYTEILSLDSL